MRIQHSIWRFAGLLLLVGIFSGCTGAMSDVTIPIVPVNPVEIGHGQEPQIPVEVIDLRRERTLRRTTIGDVSLGAIILSPPETDLVKDLVVNALARLAVKRAGVTNPTKVYCGINTFSIVTPATALYWDVTAKIELILRVSGQDRMISGEAVERTWVYPSTEIISRVAHGALRQVAAAAEKELPALLAPAR